jgi:hypothetical protein
MNNIQKRNSIYLLVFLGLHLLPIWFFKYIPTQDGPSHLYNAFVLKEYDNSNYSIFQKYYQLNLRFFPNWFSYLVMFVLMSFFPPLIAEKIFLSGYVISFPLSILYFIRGVEEDNKKESFFPFVGFLFVYHYLFQLGFYNFCYSTSFYFFALGYWWKFRYHFQFKRVIVLGMIVVLIYFCHLFSVVLFFISISFFYLFDFLVSCNRKKLRRSLPIFLLLFLPIPTWGKIGKWLLKSFLDLLSMQILISFSPVQILIWVGLICIVGLIGIGNLVGQKRHKLFFQWSKTPFFYFFIFFIIIYFVAPPRIKHGGFIKDRMLLYLILASLPYLNEKYKKTHFRIKKTVKILIVLVIFLNLGLTSYFYKKLNQEIAEFTLGISKVEPNKTILPLCFTKGDGYKIAILLHTSGYYGLKGMVDLSNYETLYSYFPVHFKPNLNRPAVEAIEGCSQKINISQYLNSVDYILIWRLPKGGKIVNQIHQHYKLIFEEGNLKIFSRR